MKNEELKKENIEVKELTDDEIAASVGGVEMDSDGWTTDPAANCKYPPGTKVTMELGRLLMCIGGTVLAVNLKKYPHEYRVERNMGGVIEVEEWNIVC